MEFTIGSDTWQVFMVDSYCDLLVDRTNTRTVATTDPTTYSIYVSEDLDGDFLVRVLIHEIAHCVLFSYGLLGTIHKMTKRRCWIPMEEFICNIIADYIMEITEAYKKISTWYSRSFV